MSELKLPSDFYNHKTECNGCRGCKSDDFVFDQHEDINSDLKDDNPLPLEQPKKQFSKKPTPTAFGQLPKSNETSRNIFSSMNSNSTSDQGLFTQLSFTPTKDATSVFGNSNIFGGNTSIFPKSNEEPKVTTPADEVKKNFSFTNSLKPSVFGQNIFGQAATQAPLTFGNKTEDTSTAKAFSFGETFRENTKSPLNTTTTTVKNAFSFGESFDSILCEGGS